MEGKINKGSPIMAHKFVVLALVFVGLFAMFKIVKAEPLGFRDCILGMSKNEVMAKIKSEAETSGSSIVCLKNFCRADTKIKNAPITAYYFFQMHPHRGDILTSISFEFDPSDYEKLKEAIIEKYGEPARTKKDILQTMMGVIVEDEKTFWTLPDGLLSISKYGKTIKKGFATMGSHESIEVMKKKEAKDKAAPGF